MLSSAASISTWTQWAAEPRSFGEHLREVGSQLSALTDAFRKLEAAYEFEVQLPDPGRGRYNPRMPTGGAVGGAMGEGLMKLWYDAIAATPDLGGEVTSRASTPSEKEKPSQWLEALVNGTQEDVNECLRQGADPNEHFARFSCIGKEFSSGTPLCIAALRNDKGIVRTLLAASADPASEYSFVAGAEQIIWSGPAIHATLPFGYMDVLELLIGAKANMHATGSNGANVVWQAAYFGQPGVLQHCLNQNVDMSLPAVSQDDHTLSYTPLHVAALTGHTGVVKVLLANSAKHDVEDGRGHSPLDDAVAQGHADVTKYLVMHSADIFKVTPCGVASDSALTGEKSLFSWHRSDSHIGKEHRCLDLVFASENPLLLSAVAQGLCHAPELLSYLSSEDFIGFLRAGGHTPVHILKAIFQPHHVRYWEDENGRRYRRNKTSAFLATAKGVNIAEGPHLRVIQRCFHYKRPLPHYALEFLETLLPSKGVKGTKMMYVPVTAYMSHIPWLHKDLKVLLAIADCETSQIFNNPGCQAIISVLWGHDAVLARFRMLMAFFEVINLVFINITLNYNTVSSSEKTAVLLAANVFAAVVWAVAVFFEVAQAIGYVASSLTKRYLATIRYWFDLFVLFLTSGIIIGTWELALDAASNAVYSTCLGALVFLKWMRFLIYLRQIPGLGVRILPISDSLYATGPFVVVLCVCLVGAANFYHALGIESVQESAVVIYRLVVLGDLDMSELEGVFPTKMNINGTTIMQDYPTPTKYYWVVRALVVVVSFIVGILMMNLFVAILCLSYSQAAEGAWLSFMRSRANIVLDQYAIRVGMERLLCPRRAWKKKSQRVSRASSTSTSDSLADELEEARSAYIWFARPGDIEK